MAGWQDYGNYQKRYGSFTKDFDLGFKQDKVYRSDKLRDHYIDMLKQQQVTPEVDEKRGFLDRSLDTLMTPVYTMAGGFNALIDGGVDEEGNELEDLNPLKGMWEGFKAGNPFGKGNKSGEKTFSDVLETAGWEPTSTLGKIAKGTVGFGLDVLLDPTTYLTGGISAIVKGTGRVGKTAMTLDKLGAQVGKLGHANVIDDLITKGINPDLAKRFADKKLASGAFTVDASKGMTEAMALTIVKSQTKKGVVKSEEEFMHSASKLADEYNRVLGVRDAKGAGDVTWGLGNLPFAPKKWDKFNVRLGSQEGLQKASDKLKISNGYQALRSSVYGTQIGKMFSTTSPLSKLAHDNPAKLWEGLEFMEHTRGLKLDKLQEEKLIRDRFKSFGLNEADNKEVLKLLQDKTVWNKIAQKAKVTDLAKFQEIKTTFDDVATSTKSEIDSLMEKQAVTKTLQEFTDNSLTSNHEVLEVLNKEYRDQLASLDVKNVTQIDDMKSVVQALDDEIGRLDTQIGKTQGDANALDELHRLSVDERKAMDVHMQNRADVQGSKVSGTNKQENVTGKPERKSYIDSAKNKELEGQLRRNASEIRRAEKSGDDATISQLRGERQNLETQVRNNRNARDTANPIETSEVYDDLAKGLNQSIDDEALRLGDNAPGRANTKKLQEALSNHVFGESGHLMTIRDSNIDDLMKRIKKGETPEQLRAHIENNPAMFSPHMQDVFKQTAEELGYKAWHGDGFKEPLGKLLGKSDDEMKKATTLDLHKEASAKFEKGELNEKQVNEFMGLLQKDLQRRILVQKYGKMTPSELITYRTKLADEKLLKDFNVGEDGMLDLKRQGFVDDVSASAGRKGNAFNDKDYVTEFAKLNSSDRVGLVQDMIAKGIFNKDAVFKAIDGNNPGLYKHMNAIIDEVDALIKNQFKKNWEDLNYEQKNLALKMAMTNIKKGQHGVDEVVSQRALKELQRRAQEDAVKAVEKEVSIGHDLLFKKGKDTYRGIVETVTHDKDGFVQYGVKVPTSGEVISGIRPSDVTKVRKGKVSRTPEEILGQSDTVKADIARKQELVKELRTAQEEVTVFTGKAKQSREDVVSFYEKRVAEQKNNITKLETDHAEYSKLLTGDLSDDALEAVTKRLDDIEKTLASDDALEVWMRTHNQADVEILKDPLRYIRNVVMRDDIPEGYFASTTKKGIEVNSKPIDKKVFFSALKQWEKELGEKGITWDEIKKIIDEPKKMDSFIMEHELSHVKHKDWETRPNRGDYSDPATRAIETRASTEALEILKNFDIDKMLRDATPVDAGKIWLTDMASSTRIEGIVRTLRAEFDRIGLEEVRIGKLTQEQFDGMLGQYIPHIVTQDGAEHFAKLRELTEHGSKVTHDLGYGVKYNPYAKSRTIKGKTVEEINEHFRETLKGRNLFSENVADVYVARALEHTELMYDDKYMRTMMNVFGHEVPADGVLREGYKAVMNHGMLKATTSDIASMNLSVHISDAVTNFIEANVQQIKGMALASGKNEQELIKAHIDDFLKKSFPDEALSKLFDGFHKDSLKNTKLSDQILGREGVPMVEMNADQITGMRASWDEAYNAQLASLDRSMKGALSRGDMERVAQVQKNMEKFGQRTPPQIRQVNDVIVQKANQARQLQQAKDQSHFLQVYDRFLHFMKLNQTVVTPAFHMRNKVSNAYLNWLGVGKDAVNKDFQIATVMLAKNEGDIAKLLDEGKFGSKQLKTPLNIENPHASLVSSVNLNNGQLHWTDLYELATRYDVIDKGAFAHDIGAGAGTKGLFKGLRKTRKDGSKINLDPTDTENFFLYKAGTKIGTTVENGDRLLHFASQLKAGKSVDESARSTQKFLFDYSDLTAFEQSVMKRIFPYYTWLRKNARLQVSQLIEQPGKFRDVAKVYTGIEHMTPEEERINQSYLGNWAQDWLQMPWDAQTRPESIDPETGEVIPAKKEKVLFNPALPFMDLNRIPDPSQPLGSLKELFTQMAPQIKVPVEQAFNKNVFLDSKLVEPDSEGETGFGLLPRIQHLASQFGLANIAGNLTGADNPADFGMAVASTTTGAKMTSVDYETSKFMMMDKWNTEGKGFDDALGRSVNALAGRALGNMGESLGKGASSTLKGMFGSPPVKAGEYENASRPISAEKYNQLSDKDKTKYTLPTHDEGVAYSKKAVELEEKAYKESGVVKKFVWSMIDGLDKKPDSSIGYVTKVSDGDTFRVKIGDKETEVRMLLVDTPETVDPRKPVMPGGQEASAHTKKTLINKDVRLVFDGTKKDKYGRMLAYVELDGKDFGKDLVERGLGKTRYTYKDYPNNTDQFKRTNEYYDAEKKASESKKGIWQYDGYATPGEDEDYKLDAVARYLQKLNQ